MAPLWSAKFVFFCRPKLLSKNRLAAGVVPRTLLVLLRILLIRHKNVVASGCIAQKVGTGGNFLQIIFIFSFLPISGTS